jgi:uncharacterized protein YjbI with pentapeptide repeats
MKRGRRADGEGTLSPDLRRIIRAHRLWLDTDGRRGSRAELQDHDLRDQDLTGVELSGADLTGADLRGARLDRARFRLARLRGAHLDGATIQAACFDGADLGLAVFDRAQIADTRFEPIQIVGDDGRTVRAEWPARLGGARFRRARITGCSFRGADLQNVSFKSAEIVDCDFENARLQPPKAAPAANQNGKIGLSACDPRALHAALGLSGADRATAAIPPASIQHSP